MRKVLFAAIVIALALPSAVWADSYSSLWKQYNAASEKDLPQNQLTVLGKIASKASAERAYGQLLKAQMTDVAVRENLSPDSLRPAVARLEKLQAEAMNTDLVLAAVYQSVLGVYYRDNSSLADDAAERSKQWFDLSLSHPDALAKAFTTDYAPFVIDGIDSNIFADDMLHVLGFEAGRLQLMHDYYEASGNRAATCIVALKMLQQRKTGSVASMRKSKYMQSVDSLLSEYRDLTVAGEVAIERYGVMSEAEDATAKQKMKFIDYSLVHWGAWPRMNVLRNAQTQLTLPSFHVSLGDEVAVPNMPRKVLLMRVCNVNELTMTVRRVNVDGNTELNPADEKDYAKLKAKLTSDEPFTQTHRYLGIPNYVVTRDTMQIDGLPVGVYLVEFTTDNASIKTERALLRVSNLYVVCQKQPNKKARLVVLNATTGQPVPGAKVRLTTRTGYGTNAKSEVQTLTCDARGEATCDASRSNVLYYAYTDDDKAQKEVQGLGYYSYYNQTSKSVELNVYTDRSIYRPGQTVNVSAILFESLRDDASALASKTIKATLRDANYREVRSTEIVTDAYGTASTSFVLPTQGLTGNYSISLSSTDARGAHGTAYFRVEQYKRPTFEVEFDKPATKYQEGDTLSLAATARTYSGVAVQGAKVVYKVVRRPSLWWWRSMRDGSQQVHADSAVTDASGRFIARIPMMMPDDDEGDTRVTRFYSFDVEATVTDAGGESHAATASLPLGDKPTAFTCDLPERIERDSLKAINFVYKNSAGQDLDGDIVYYIDDMRFTAKANKRCPLNLSSLSSASHQFTAYCGNDTISREFVTFTLADKRCATHTHDWYYATSTQFPADGRPVYVQCGSSDSIQHVVYSVLSGDRVVENGVLDLQNEVDTRAFTYKEEYGDGLLLTCAWVKEGKLYQHNLTLQRPVRDNRLNATWSTFRDRLTPGQKEEWTLHVASTDGRPAKAQVMATMYDKSLDQISAHSWNLIVNPRLYQPQTSWRGRYVQLVDRYGEMSYRPLDERALDFSHYEIQHYLAQPVVRGGRMYKRAHMAMNTLSAGEDEAATGQMANVELMALSSKMATDNDLMEEAAAAEPALGAQPMAETSNTTSQLRENTSETAFFFPNIETDASGNVKLKFTLPESVTTWRVLGIAHDSKMNVGQFEGEAVAQKAVMVQPNVPRFVRSTDKGTLVARISNTSGRAQSGTARLQFVSPESNKAVYSVEQKFSLPADTTVAVALAYDMNKLKAAHDGLLICRVTAEGRGFSDGEQHYLPVIEAKETVNNTLPFTQTAKGTQTVDLSTLFEGNKGEGRLTVEYTENPAWLMVQTLPSCAEQCGQDAISLASAYYVNMVGRTLMTSNKAIAQTVEVWNQQADKALVSPLESNSELKQLLLDETPWVASAQNETDAMRRLSAFYNTTSMENRCDQYVQKLKALQNHDGSFSWWPGMSGSTYATASIATTLARLQHITAAPRQVSNMLSKAISYLGAQVAKECTEMRRREKEGSKTEHPSELATTYLYICSLTSSREGMTISRQTDYDYIANHIARENASLSIAQKARAAVVLNASGYKSEAATLVESIRQYLVGKPGMGRYFDTRKAAYSWRDYRIPTQVAAIEALHTVCPADTQTVADMRLWLLQSKRTQGWDTPINTVDAVHAFLGTDGSALSIASNNAPNAVIKVDGSELKTTAPVVGTGYVKASKTATQMRSLTVDKQSSGTSWGAVYAQYEQPLADVVKSDAGISVERTFYRDGKRLTDLTSLHKGDCIIVRISITADRDYDFVSVADHRAACMEPVSQTSAYRSGCYVSPKDAATYFYFDRLAKGTHQVETEYYVDREGQYRTGLCTAQCAYSPAFSGRAASVLVGVK